MVCKIPFCKNTASYKTPKIICKLHYKRWWRYKNFDLQKWYKPSKSSQGYLTITINGKRKLQHRHIMEEFLQRKLSHNEQIHHKNGIKTDNRIENLELINPSQHIKKYHSKKFKIDWTEISVPHKTINHICLVGGCHLKTRARNLCLNHYRSYLKFTK